VVKQSQGRKSTRFELSHSARLPAVPVEINCLISMRIAACDIGLIVRWSESGGTFEGRGAASGGLADVDPRPAPGVEWVCSARVAFRGAARPGWWLTVFGCVGTARGSIRRRGFEVRYALMHLCTIP
jgi:hypothetical protein